MTFGKQLQTLRKEKGLSQDALANQLYVTRQSVSQWENDKTMPSVDLLLKISEIFGTTVDALLGKPQTESIPQPLTEARVLRTKKEIAAAMRYEFATATVVMLSLGLLFFGLWLITVLFERHLHSPEVFAMMKNDYLNAWQFAVLGAVCAAAAAVTRALGIIHTRSAVKFGRNHACSLRFFYDHLVIEEENAEPLSLFYANIRRFTETDGYFILQMQNRTRMCVKKSDVDNAAEVSKLLKSAKNYLDRRLSRSDAPMGRAKRCMTRFIRDFLFVATFLTPTLYTIHFRLLSTVLADNQPLKTAVFAVPFVILAAEIAVGIMFTVRSVRAKRMMIAGGVGMAAIILMAAVTNSAGTLYNLQHERVTSEQFVAYMQEHGMTVDDTIKGREETFIAKCYTARPQDNGFEVLYMEFDPYSRTYGLFSANEAYGSLLNEIRSQPRQTTRYTSQDVVFNAFYTEVTNNHYAYVSLNEYSVIYINASPEREQAIHEVLRDWELKRPY